MSPIKVRFKSSRAPTGYEDGLLFSIEGSDAIVSPRSGGFLRAVPFYDVVIEVTE